ncbi:23S rRNA (uracil(1939)-C(5))-methyltransferase RlmD [Tumebacillus algifaecis]|uniref:23S rRNA (Uracil(1939)-C(5))-methyltransferase RlmD n=1 Tax=Tumebacillus algifaecis TaxID=1214604 RepID=A0A223CYF8_9BACL|nr:23S rRNA (uracil(1939)-C(5))-methyltransferase RlmD [Tumebacillus algifaecis]ASS74204.1 23S rRNA (uracil(1939)-C(5))-methyltransferase RlmD [Tumebacillus algifaecis]
MAKPKLQVPVEKNQYIELDITGLGHEGEGVGKYEGFTVFIPRALPGERVKAKVIRVQKTYANGRLIEVLSDTASRTEPPCPIFHRCGGCHLQHMTYEAQLKHKRQTVVDALTRIGKLEGVTVHETLGMDNPWQYRNKAQVPIGEIDGRLAVGFYAPRTHEIIEMQSCDIQHAYNDQIVHTTKAILQELAIPHYEEASGRGLVRHIIGRAGFHTGETMLVLVTNGRKIPHQEVLIDRLRARIPHLVSIVQNINREQTNVIFGNETRTLWGKDTITDTIGEIRFEISAGSFFQVNPVQTEVLYGKALEYANLSGSETVIDAYCGIGTISLFLAQKAKEVYGVEIVPEAIEDAQKNAALNEIRNAHFAVGEAETVIPQWHRDGVRADVLVVDPPRKGCDERLLATIAEMQPERVVYVSCNPGTLARDLRYLEDHGYKTVEVTPVDMFPHTFHVECVAWLVRKDN